MGGRVHPFQNISKDKLGVAVEVNGSYKRGIPLLSNSLCEQ